MVPPLLSILIPAITERLPKLIALTTKLERQIADCSAKTCVEIISVVDNRIVSIGHKRQAVLNSSTGMYVAFVDDDDDVSDNYIRLILHALREYPGVDVVTFDNWSYIEDHKPIVVNMRRNQQNDEVRFNDASDEPVVVKRGAWHTCVWRSVLAKQSKFPNKNYSEDWEWAAPLNRLAQTEYHIDDKLHFYFYNSRTSRATDRPLAV